MFSRFGEFLRILKHLLDACIEGGRLLLEGQALAPLGNAPGPVTLGLRAEDLRIAVAGLPMRVDYVEELGAQRVIHGMVGDQALAVTDAHDAPLGPEVRIAVDPSKLHLFDARTGRRMDKRLELIAEPAQ